MKVKAHKILENRLIEITIEDRCIHSIQEVNSTDSETVGFSCSR